MSERVVEYLTAYDYWQRYEPGCYALLSNPDKAMIDDTSIAAQIAERIGETPIMLLGKTLPAFRRCVWEMVYSLPSMC